MSDDLVKWLDDLAAVEGEPTATVLKKAADRIQKLEAALRSIAANACCDSCREAALVARKALDAE